MSIHICSTFKNRPDGTRGLYYYLRRYYWDYEKKLQRNKYLAYLGTKPEISLEKAKAICTKLGISLDELKQVKNLTIISI